MIAGSVVCSSFKRELLLALHNFQADLFRLALYDATADLNANTVIYTTSGEVNALGYSPATVIEEKVDIGYSAPGSRKILWSLRRGQPTSASFKNLCAAVAGKEFDLHINLNLGKASALMYAAEQDQLENVRVLLQAGADVNLKDDDGDTAMSLAYDKEVKELLMSYGAKAEEEEKQADEPADN